MQKIELPFGKALVAVDIYGLTRVISFNEDPETAECYKEFIREDKDSYESEEKQGLYIADIEFEQWQDSDGDIDCNLTFDNFVSVVDFCLEKSKDKSKNIQFEFNDLDFLEE